LNRACKDSFGAGPRLPTVRCGKTNCWNCSRLSSVGMPRDCSHFAILIPKKKGACIESGDGAKIQQPQKLNGGFDPSGNPQPVDFDASYYLAPDGKAGKDVYAVLRDAIASTGKMALARVVIARRERAVGIIPMGPGLVAHTLHEERDLNNASDVFDDLPTGKSDPEMVKLATQLIERQTGKYDPADVEDRYEARLRDVIDAKLKGEGIEAFDEEEPDRGNVIDLMSALRKSLGSDKEAAPSDEKKSAPAKKSSAPKKSATKAGAKRTSAARKRA
jgi:DNA end-binding protein Ku